MLVLSRKPGETIVIGTPAGLVTVKINWVRGDKVSLAIDAPPQCPVHRQEVQSRIDASRSPAEPPAG